MFHKQNRQETTLPNSKIENPLDFRDHLAKPFLFLTIFTQIQFLFIIKFCPFKEYDSAFHISLGSLIIVIALFINSNILQ